MLVPDLIVSSDNESDEMEDQESMGMLEEATLAAGSASSSSSVSSAKPPQEFFDELLRTPKACGTHK
jgi:hypothetical protein